MSKFFVSVPIPAYDPSTMTGDIVIPLFAPGPGVSSAGYNLVAGGTSITFSDNLTTDITDYVSVVIGKYSSGSFSANAQTLAVNGQSFTKFNPYNGGSSGGSGTVWNYGDFIVVTLHKHGTGGVAVPASTLTVEIEQV